MRSPNLRSWGCIYLVAAKFEDAASKYMKEKLGLYHIPLELGRFSLLIFGRKQKIKVSYRLTEIYQMYVAKDE